MVRHLFSSLTTTKEEEDVIAKKTKQNSYRLKTFTQGYTLRKR